MRLDSRCRRVFAVGVITLSAAVVVPRAAWAAQLTQVQEAYGSKQPLTFLVPLPNAPARVGLPLQPSALVRPTTEFKPTRRWKVFVYSLELAFWEHLLRVAAQPESRSELGGPFFRDWFDSVHVPKKWGDQDAWEVNYIGHAIHGSAAARIWLDQREPKATTAKQYLASMGRALIFTVIFSELFENGPMSEASIGNVARRQDRTGWVDHFWTPVGGVLWTMGEDAIDRYLLRWLEGHVPFVMPNAAARMILNPGRMLANVSQHRAPWFRQDRILGPSRTGR